MFDDGYIHRLVKKKLLTYNAKASLNPQAISSQSMHKHLEFHKNGFKSAHVILLDYKV